jgi:hypothetical protein
MKDTLLLQRRSTDDNGDRLGDWQTVARARAEITWLRGGEAVMQSRLQGVQPAILRVYRTPTTRQVDGSWRAVNARDAAQVFAIESKTPNRDDPNCFDLLAKTGGSDA